MKLNSEYYMSLAESLKEHFECYVLVGFTLDSKKESILISSAKTELHQSACAQLMRKTIDDLFPTLVEVVDRNDGEDQKYKE